MDASQSTARPSDVSPPPKPRGLVLYPENRDFVKKIRPRPAWPMPSRWMLGLNALVLLISLIVFLLLAIPPWTDWLKMRNDGVVITGTLLSAETTGARNDIMWVEYEYHYDFRWYTNRETLDADDFDAIVAQQYSIRVRVLPDDPGEATLEDFDAEGETLRIVLTILGVIWILMVLIGLVLGMTEYDRKDTLAKQGRMVRGEIVSYKVDDLSNADDAAYLGARVAGGFLGILLYSAYRKWRPKKRKPGKGLWRSTIHYRFTSPDSGKVIEKTERIKWNEEGDLPLEVPPGTQIAVYYRTDRHSRPL